MALAVGTDTYATLVEAAAYATARPWLSSWAGLASDDVREAYMREAAIYLDQSYAWRGSIAVATQAMAFPRTDLYDDEGRLITGIPERLKSAQIELAIHGITARLVQSRDTGDVKKLKAGSVSLEFVDGQQAKEGEVFAWVDRLVSGLFDHRAGNASGNVALLPV